MFGMGPQQVPSKDYHPLEFGKGLGSKFLREYGIKMSRTLFGDRRAVKIADWSLYGLGQHVNTVSDRSVTGFWAVSYFSGPKLVLAAS